MARLKSSQGIARAYKGIGKGPREHRKFITPRIVWFHHSTHPHVQDRPGQPCWCCASTWAENSWWKTDPGDAKWKTRRKNRRKKHFRSSGCLVAWFACGPDLCCDDFWGFISDTGGHSVVELKSWSVYHILYTWMWPCWRFDFSRFQI